MAGILPWVPRLNITKTIAVTPTISTSAYTSGDQIGGIMTLSNVIRQDSQMNYGNAELVAVTILDADKQSAAMDIWLFNQSPTVTSTDNAAFAMTAANQAAQCIGFVSVGASYSAAAAVSTASTANLNLPVQVAGTVASPTNLYAIAIVRAAPTYTTTTSLQFQFSFFVD
jgi:hypothetical protein